MLKCMKAHWKRAVSGLLAVIMAAGMLPVSAFAADTSDNSNLYAPTGSFESVSYTHLTLPTICSV